MFQCWNLKNNKALYMKRILLILSVLLCLVSCSNKDGIIEGPQPPVSNLKEYIVSLGFSGEITDIVESPLSKAVVGNDLYGVQVYSSLTSEDNYQPYAYGLFDDKSNMTIKLLEGYKYKFLSTMIVDGKINVYQHNGGYGVPFGGTGSFYPEIKPEFTYTISNMMEYLDHGITFLKTGMGVLDRPNIDRYYGELVDFTPAENKSAFINMKRVVFGAKFIAEGLQDGKLIISISGAPSLEIQYPETEVSDIFSFKNVYPNGITWTNDNYTETVQVSISWEKADGALVPLVTQDITFKRNTLTTVTVKVKDVSVNSGVDISEDKTPMTDGDKITIEAGSGTDTDVTPNP